eukprot:scaffold23860_cov44-Phaeocystis_antarctica.AAC.2
MAANDHREIRTTWGGRGDTARHGPSANSPCTCQGKPPNQATTRPRRSPAACLRQGLSLDPLRLSPASCFPRRTVREALSPCPSTDHTIDHTT